MRGFIKHRLSNLTAQSTIEYAILTACVVAALLGMQFYVKRSTQGRMKQAGDEIGEAYEPLSVTSNIQTNITSNITVNQTLVQLTNATSKEPLVDQYGQPVYGIKSNTQISEDTERGGSETLGVFEKKLFK